MDSPRDLALRSKTLLSVVVADAAVEAARQAVPHLSDRHVYVDMNSVSPRTKAQIDTIVRASGASFVEAAVMAPVPKHGHQVPILLGGPAAPLFADMVASYGMRTEIVSDRVGSAAAVKMCRSIVVKGLEALLLECAVAAAHYDASERVFESLDESFPGLEWSNLASYMISRVVAHGERRAQEMGEVSKTLEDLGIEPIMAQAAARRQKWCADLAVRPQGDGAPNYRDVVKAIRQVLERSSPVAPGKGQAETPGSEGGHGD